MMKKILKVLLIITTIINLLTIIFAVIPFYKLSWVYSMILPLINIGFYIVMVILLIKSSHNLLNILLLLFIPLYIFGAIHICTVGDLYYSIVSLIIIIFMSLISIMNVIFAKNQLKVLKIKIISYVIVIFIISGIFIVISSVINNIYYQTCEQYGTKNILFYVPLIMYFILSIIYVIMILLVIRIKKKNINF
jgi:hypothetical protein